MNKSYCNVLKISTLTSTGEHYEQQRNTYPFGGR